jgi:hypothetical protein
MGGGVRRRKLNRPPRPFRGILVFAGAEVNLGAPGTRVDIRRIEQKRCRKFRGRLVGATLFEIDLGQLACASLSFGLTSTRRRYAASAPSRFASPV